MEHDIFISYRRDGGEAMAVLLRDRLTVMGYNAFLDIDGLNSGKFPQKLYSVIRGCKDFIVICSKSSFDRCVNEGDWLRIEIAHALKCEKNIIPLIMRGFEFPDNLPDYIADIRDLNYVAADRSEYFDAAFERLTQKFLESKPTKEPAPAKEPVPATPQPAPAKEPVTVSAQPQPAPAKTNVKHFNIEAAPIDITRTDKIIVGDKITFGDYIWRVLEVHDDQALIITEDVLELRRFDKFSNSWGSSDLKKYLNSEFISSFDSESKSRINGEIFLLGRRAVSKYFKEYTERIAKYKGENYGWWLRTPESEGVIYVSNNGHARVLSGTVDYIGVRPALWLKL